jgi:HEAT repeat protein
MLRSTRASYALLRSLILGTVTITSTVAVSTVIVGCENDKEPDYWVGKLEDPKWRPRAVKRLTQFLNDALQQADGKTDDPAVKELENKLVAPLSQVYVDSYSDLDTKTRVTLIKLLADFRDDRAIPALKAAFDNFAKKPRKTADEADIKWAVRAYGDMKSKELAPSVLAAFKKLKASTPLGTSVYKDYSKAMVAGASTVWTDDLIELFDVKIKHPTTGKTKQQKIDLVPEYRDQLFWQVTAAQVLGALKEKQAVEPLIKIIVDPAKGDIATTAILALVKIGKPSVDRAVKLLNEDDPLVAYAKKAIKNANGAKQEPEGNPVVDKAAAIIGLAGRSDGVKPIIAALGGKLSDEDKVLLARELPKMPVTDESKAAFKKTFESIPLSVSVQHVPGLILLAEAAGQFYDQNMVEWLLKRAEKTKGGGEEKKGLQETLVTTALKLAGPKQWPAVAKAAKKYKMDDLAKAGDKIVNLCKEDVACYLKEIEKGENQTKKNQIVGIKAGYMLGVLGNEQTRDLLVDALGGIEHPAVTFVALQSIDHLSSKAAPQIVEKMEKLVEKNEKSGDRQRLAANSAIKQVIYRVSVR